MRPALILTFAALLLGFAPEVHAQSRSLTEGELSVQSMLIDAERDYLLGRYDKAEPVLMELIRKYPEEGAMAFLLAKLRVARQDLPAALVDIRRARQADPANRFYAVYEGDLLEKTGQYAAAADLYGELVARYPREEQFYVQQAFYLVRDGRPQEAVQVYESLEMALGASWDTSRKKFMLYQGMGKVREAASVLEAYLQRHPGQIDVMYMLAGLYEEHGVREEAAAWYRRILEKHPGESRARLAALRLTGPEKASEEDELGALARIFSDPTGDLDQKIKAMLPHIRRYTDAPNDTLEGKLRELTTALRQAHPAQAKVESIFGDLDFYAGRSDSAALHYRAALELDQSIYALWEQALLASGACRDYRGQYELASRAMDLFPNQAHLHYLLAEAALETGRFSEALDAVQTGRLMARRDGFLLYQIALVEGSALAALGQRDKAERAFETALSLNPRGPEALARRALSAVDPAAKCKAAEEAQAADPSLPMVRFAMAQCHFYAGRYTPCLTLLGDLLAKDFPHPAWLELAGDAQALSGNIAAALLHWERVRAMGLGSSRLQEKIQSRRYIE